MPDETTKLTPLMEVLFKQWVKKSGISDADASDSKYDYRGFFQNPQARANWHLGDHFPDTYKQHGHPTFSRESKYSLGPDDGGRWDGETYLPQLATSKTSLDPNQLHNSLLNLLRGDD